jgi:hypothetical protein
MRGACPFDPDGQLTAKAFRFAWAVRRIRPSRLDRREHFGGKELGVGFGDEVAGVCTIAWVQAIG